MGYLKTFAKGVALGGIVGVIYGLFNAPRKGSELKKELAPKLRKAIVSARKVEKKALSKGKKVVKKAVKIEKKAVKKYNKRKKK